MRAWWMTGAFLLGLGAARADENPLARYRWNARVVVVSAPASGDPRLKAQRAELARAGSGLRERDLVVLEAVGDTAEARRLRAALGLPGDGFRVVLVGKDGGPKRTGTEPLPAGTLFGTIDAMPMRRDEMGR